MLSAAFRREQQQEQLKGEGTACVDINTHQPRVSFLPPSSLTTTHGFQTEENDDSQIL